MISWLFKIVIHIFLLMLVVSMFSCGQINGQDNDKDYYFVDGKKITLEPSKNYGALKIKRETSEFEKTYFKAGIDSAEFGRVESSAVLEKRGIVLVQIKLGVGPASFMRSMQILGTQPQVEAENPVYGVSGVDHVLVNEFIVQFKEDVLTGAIEAMLRDMNVTVVQKYDKIKNRYIVSFAGKSPREALQACNTMLDNPSIQFAEPNFIRIYPQRPKIKKEGANPQGNSAPGPQDTPGDPLYSQQWSLNNTGSTGIADADIDAPEAWDIGKGSSELILAIIDEGVDISHPDLSAKIITPYDATDGDNDQQPNAWDGHGTSCAGIAAAISDNNLGVSGVDWNVKILPVRIAYSNYSAGPWITSNLIIEDGIRTAVDRNARILSNSWGGGSPSSAINSAIDYAIAADRVLVFAAGNDAEPVGYPANLSLQKTLIAVSATNEWDEFKTRTSSDGEDWWGSNFGSEITIAAPGVHIYTTDISGSDGYASGDYVSNFNGTSSATPIVAGVAALIVAQNRNWSPAQVRQQLQNTADDLGNAGFDTQFGYGRINACNALGGNCSYESNGGNDQVCCGSAAATIETGNRTADRVASVALNIFFIFVLPILIYKRRY
jgi:subtilisin family serine protease